MLKLVNVKEYNYQPWSIINLDLKKMDLVCNGGVTGQIIPPAQLIPGVKLA